MEENKQPGQPEAAEKTTKTQRYSSVDELIGKIEGIERTILVEESDTLLNTIEKIALIPDSKLVLVEPVQVPYRSEHGTALA